jgi:acetyl-CoA carboxylase biotin carboxyl carrier protein
VPLTAQDVAEITRLLEESDFDELHVEQDGFKLTLKRNSAGRVAPGASAAAAGASAPPASPSVPSPAATAVASATAPAATAADPTRFTVPAPLLGTFYRAPRPGAAPYIDVGSSVQEDTIVGIIEVMKLMNTVRAGVRGEVVEILAQDGVLVEYGQPLLSIAREPQP